MKRFLWLGFVLFLYGICTGCGDTFRPIIIPNPPTFPNPKAAHTVVAINDNPPPAGQPEVAPGSAMVIDVSGDSDVSVKDVGLAPVHAVQQTANQVLVVNHSVSGPLNTGDSLTKLNFSGTTIGNTTTISLPANSAPNFVAVAPTDTTAYVTLPNFVPDPINFPNVVVPSVGVVSTLSNNMATTITVGRNPVALAVTPDKSKLYVANKDDSTVSGFNTVDRSQRVGSPASTTSPPIWLSVRSDNQRVYALEQDGTLAWLDTTSTAGPDTLTESTTINVPFATTMVYDSNRNRLYIPGGLGGQEVAIVDVSQSIPNILGGGPILISTVPPAFRSIGDPCATGTESSPLHVVAVAALPDGSRAYVGSFYLDNLGNVCPQVTVIDASSNTVRSSIAIPGFPDATVVGSPYYAPVCATTRFRFMMAAGGDSSRAYLASCDGGNVNIIDTSNDTYIENLPAPVGSRPPIPPNPLNPPQNPVFLFAGP